MQKLEPDMNKLTPEQRDKLDNYNSTQKQLRHLSDIADMVQELVTMADENDDSKEMGAILLDIRESLAEIKTKEAPEAPDYSKPVVDAVSKLETALKASMKVVPQIKVDAPVVNVSPSSVDLKGVESAVKQIPKAFEQAIKLIKIPEVPQTDNSDLLSAWAGISEQLESIDTATRMKPTFPGSIGVNNLHQGFLSDTDVNTEIITVGTIKTIIQTDGTKICTTTIDSTNPLDKLITKVWS